MNSNSTIPFGDVVSQICQHLFIELQQVLSTMKQQDPELRTQQFRQYLIRSKKLLCQLHYLSIWLNNNYFKNLFSQTNVFYSQLQEIQDSLNTSQDNLYFIHRDIFPRRSRKYEIEFSKDILTTKTYGLLPQGIFHNGSCAHPKFITSEEVIDNLNIYISAKLKLVDNIPTTLSEYYIIRDGKLILQFPNLYELHLTLAFLDEKADWIVLGCKTLVRSHDEDKLPCGFNTLIADQNLLMCLRQHSSLPIEELEINREKLDNSHIKAKKTTIEVFHKVCYHASVAISLRVMLLQIKSLSSSLWKNYLECDFHDIQNFPNILTMRFWKGCVSKSFQYELQVILPLDVGDALMLKLYILPDQLEDYNIFNNQSVLSHPSLFGNMNALDYIQKNGVDSIRLFYDILARCCDYRIAYLYQKLIKTFSIYKQLYEGYSYSIENEDRLLINFKDSRYLQISVDMFSGTYCINYSQSKLKYEDNKNTIDSFINEINNVESELQCQQLFGMESLEDVLNYSHTLQLKPLTTLSSLLLCVSKVIIDSQLRLMGLFNRNLEVLGEAFTNHLNIDMSSNVALVYNTNNFHTKEALLRPIYASIDSIVRQSSYYLNDSSSDLELYPNISVYVMFILSECLEIKTFAFICQRQTNQSILEIPTIIDFKLLLEFPFSNGPFISELEIVKPKLNEFIDQHLSCEQKPEYSVNLSNEFHIFLPQPRSSSEDISAITIVLISYPSDKKQLIVSEVLVISTEGFNQFSHLISLNSYDIVRISLEDHSRMKQCALYYLGTLSILISPNKSHPDYVDLICENVSLSDSSNNENRLEYSLILQKMMQYQLTNIQESNDDNDESTRAKTTLIHDEFDCSFPKDIVFEKIFISISKIIPLIGFLYHIAIKNDFRLIEASNVYYINIAYIYRDVIVPKILLKILKDDEYSRFTEISVEFALGKQRNLNPFTKISSKAQILLPTSAIVFNRLGSNTTENSTLLNTNSMQFDSEVLNIIKQLCTISN